MTQQSFAQVFKQKCRDGDAKAVRRILSTRGGKSRLSDEDFNRGFYAAIDQGHTDVISLLLDHGASMSDEALARVCEHDNAQVVKLFLDYGWDPNTMFVYGEPGLRALLHNRKCVQLLLDRGADPNLTGQQGVPTLRSALVSCRDKDVPELLVSYGAVLKPEYIYKALAPDARASELMTRFVLAKGVDVNTPHDKWGTPLHFAIYQRREAKVKLLLDAGADPSTKTTGRNYPGKTPAELALSKGYTGMLAGLRQRVRTPANDNRAQAAAGGELLGL